MYSLIALAGAIALSIIALLLIWLRKDDPEGIRKVAGTRSYKTAMILALTALLLSVALMAYLIYFLWPSLSE